MRNRFFIAASFGLVLLMLAGCSKEHSPQPSNAHPENWSMASGLEGHGTKVLASGKSSCATCHGSDYQGGESGVSCYRCHRFYPHLEDWNTKGAAGFHGLAVDTDSLAVQCAICHGDNLEGQGDIPGCYKCHSLYPHQQGWMSKNTASFHGAYLKSVNWDLSSCAGCHGESLQGQGASPACSTCHSSYPHSSTWIIPMDSRSHIAYLRGHRFNLAECQNCHGVDYHGGVTGSNCLTCHTAPGGVESCNLCHGSAANNAPPRDTQGNTSTAVMSVGRHQLHVAERGYSCVLCHDVPATFAAAGHVYQDATPNQAEVISFWSWDRTSGTCVTACHNDPNKKYIWNQ